MNSSSRPWPTELRLRKDRKTLTVAFDDGETFDLPAEYLRVCSPSAEVQGHSPSERRRVESTPLAARLRSRDPYESHQAAASSIVDGVAAKVTAP